MESPKKILEKNNTCSLHDALNSSHVQSAIIYKDLTRQDIEKIIGMKPIDLTKYKKAFVHKSVVKNAKLSCNLPEYMQESYERYEFLGDSVLNLVIGNFLFKKYPESHEGQLTKIRTRLAVSYTHLRAHET